MIVTTECFKCGMPLEIFRVNLNKVDAYWVPMYDIYCGCPDCGLITSIEYRSISPDANIDTRRKYWDMAYEEALNAWMEKYWSKPGRKYQEDE